MSTDSQKLTATDQAATRGLAADLLAASERFGTPMSEVLDRASAEHGGAPGWAPDDEWEDDGDGDVRHVWNVAGPEPFGGLRCRDEYHAVDVCEQLNRLTGRQPPAPPPRAPDEPDLIAVALVAAIAEAYPDLVHSTDGATITFNNRTPP
jgi:hypothetical protein